MKQELKAKLEQGAVNTVSAITGVLIYGGCLLFGVLVVVAGYAAIVWLLRTTK